MVKSKRLETVLQWMDGHFCLMLLFLSILHLFTRLWLLVDIPVGYHGDELAIAYDSLSIARDHVDRYLYKMPIYFKNYGDGMNVGYIYLTAPLFKLFGYSKLALRLPAAIVGLVLLIFGSLTAKEFFRSNKAGLTVGALLTICPIFISMQRFALESPLLLNFWVMSLYFLLRGVHTGKARHYLFSGLLFGYTFYHYALGYVMIPLFFLLYGAYLLYVKKLSLCKYASTVAIAGILAIPLIMEILVNSGHLPELRFTYLSFPKLDAYRGVEFSLSHIPKNLYLIKNLFTYDWLEYTGVPEFGCMYYMSIPLILFGQACLISEAVSSIRKRIYNPLCCALAMELSIIMIVFILDNPTDSRAYCLYYPFTVCIAAAIRFIYRKARTWALLPVFAYAAVFAAFMYFYFNIYPVKYAVQVNFEPMEIYKSLETFIAKDQLTDWDTEVYIDTEKETSNVELQVLLCLQASAFEWHRVQKYGYVRNIHFLTYGSDLDRGNSSFIVENTDEAFKRKLTEAGYEAVDSTEWYTLYK